MWLDAPRRSSLAKMPTAERRATLKYWMYSAMRMGRCAWGDAHGAMPRGLRSLPRTIVKVVKLFADGGALGSGSLTTV